MDNFAGSHYYRLSRTLISAIGLWPFSRTIYTKLLNVVVILLLLSNVFSQLVKLITAKLSMALRWKVVSCIAYSCIFVVRYIGYLYYINDVKWIFQRIAYDWNSLKNEAELRIIHEYTKTMKILSIGFGLILCPTILTFFLKTFSNNILDFLSPMNYTRPRVLPVMAEYFIDEEKYFYYIAIYINVIIGFGGLSVFVSEVNSMSIVYHICGMLKIVCYRINHIHVSNIPGVSPAQRSMIIHKQIISIVKLHTTIKHYVDFIQLKVMSLYNVFCVFGLITFILALFQFAKAMSTRNDMEELLASLCIVITSVLYAFIVIHFAQKLTDHSSDIFQRLYNIEWYDLPVVQQKVVLFLMRNSLKDLTFVIGGVIVASHDMFTMYVRTAFSYFMVVYSFD
ncbi:uncharacterized protein LOC122566853 [Bombus pyrosoma]|uniref:uncharacterized protein LOC122566853 n=1 Tax=Bombus pyrosoma TaxID=396416 RepID=UPI001CB931DC|nr:uncharacterized protein LOC122566853 [Bombus pyrosoma]